MKPICFIAARGWSKGVPKKNIRIIAGKPLLAHTIEASLDSKIFSHVVVSTEDDEIASVARKYGAEVPFSRPKELAADATSMDEVLLHGINKLYSLEYKFNIIVNRDCTVPFIRNIDVEGCVRLLEQKQCDVVFGVYKQHHNPYFNMVEPNSKGFLRFSKSIGKKINSRQEAPIVYQLNGLCAFNCKKFLEYDTMYMPKAIPYEIPPETGLMIDTELEFRMAEMMFHQNYFKK